MEERTAPQTRDDRVCALSAVIDGDSIRCADGREIRLLSIDAPEFAQSPWGERSRDALLALAPLGTELAVEYDLERRDEFGRDLAYLRLPDGSLVNERMVADGYALA
ncbi:MAG: thermonuclease family protein, partial [Gemmatimonadota bacterium]|nr:thermonuclease family protein [Gemmatimonadota bacterium]